MEEALQRTIPKVWEAGVDAVITIAHECPDVLVPVVAKHPEWRLSFVGGGHCHKKMHERVGELNVMSAEWRMHQYVRVVLHVDPSLPPKSRVVSIDPSIVDVAGSPSVFPDPVLTAAVKNWKQKVDRALGVVIGHSKGGIGPEHTVGQMVAASWLEEMGGDVAIVNKGGIRQVIPSGPITHATLWGVLPFDNQLMKLSVSGENLAMELERPKFIATGVEKRADGKWLIGGKPLEKQKRYTVLITDFMYTGGDGSMFGTHDPKGVALGIQWRDPVIAWIQKQKTKVDAPLEALVGKKSGQPSK
jgi:2',3'-cyclic-nucleotide 2'-phosphodiesterase (5'-nucleotidase family)